jgi:hypothetical protein
MNGETVFMILFGLILLGYIFLYVKGRKYLERFQDAPGAGAGTGPTVAQIYPAPPPLMQPTAPIDSRPGRVVMEQTNLDPVAKDSIKSLDDFEYNMVYQNESDRELSTALKNKLMSQRPMEWAGLPPSSEKFQAGLRESFENASQTVPDNARPYQAVNGDNMIPPDTESTEMEERKILQAYAPPSAQELGSYSADEDLPPEELIKKIYAAKGLVPSVAHKEGTNVYEIVGVRKKDEKILYEDEEAPASTGPVRGAGEATITVPPTAYDTAAAKDPFYDTTAPGGKSRIGKWDYQSWTPGLDRMFAPTNQTQNWS